MQVDNYLTQVENMTRSVIEERQMRFAEVDVFSRLMADRIIFLGLPVNDEFANIIVAQMLFLESLDPKKDILLYINSPGGSVYSGLSIYDTMQFVKPDVVTICTGLAASMAAILLGGGAHGKRSALQHARIMIHQPMGGAGGQASDIEITAKQILTLKKELYDILARHSGKSFEQVEKDSDRDHWMTASQAQQYGLIDEVLIREK
ncbi:MAG: ATP-dependent Clp protease proteolytic subunit [Microscillaceae bacterium]|nr:ATP-dependent Clp protease proteolytic subunit [Microscillaceae bacterium]